MANCQLPPPDMMFYTGNAAANWRVFKESKECQQTLSRLRSNLQDSREVGGIFRAYTKRFV